MNKRQPRVVVVGCGAIGSIIGAYLCRGGLDPLLVDPWYQHVEAMKTNGLQITTPTEQFQLPVRAVHLNEFDASDEEFDTVFLATKSYDTNWMTHLLEKHINSRSTVISAQNGINEETIANMVGSDRTLGCIVHMGGGLWEPGQVLRTFDPKWATFTFGELSGAHTNRIDEILPLMQVVGDTRISENIWGALWAKLAVNCMLNASSAITGLSSATLWLNEATLNVHVHVAGEVVRVSKAAHVVMDKLHIAGGAEDIDPQRFEDADRGDKASLDHVLNALSMVAKARKGANSDSLPSMLQDMKKHRRTEVDYLNGYVAVRGRTLGIATPYNAAFPTLVKAVERAELPIDSSNMSRVTKSVLESARS